MSDLGIDAVDGSSSGISGTLAASNAPSHSSVEEFTQAMAAASNNRSTAEQSQSGGSNTPPADQTKAPNQNGGGSWLDRSLGMLQAGVGVIEVVGGVVGGVLTSETGVGAVAGGAVALHGLDDIQAGARQAWTGKPTETVTQQAVTSAAQHVGAPPPVAAAIGVGVDIVASGGVGGAEKAAVKTTEAVVKTTEAAVKTTEAAVKTTEAAVKTTEAAVKGTETAVKGTETAVKGTETAVKGSEDSAKLGAEADKAAKGELGATSTEAAKGIRPQSVIKNQATQDELIANQQKQLQEAIERGGAKEKGRVLDAQGTQVENITRNTLEQVEGAKVTPDVRIGTGEGAVIDNVVERGGKSVYVESKLTIAEPNTRMINQLTNATKAAQPGDSVILQVAREPTPGEIANLRSALGDDVFSKIKIVSNQTNLFDVVTAALK
jgi:hypothetical protein